MNDRPPCDFCGLPALRWLIGRPFTRRVPIGGKIHSLNTTRTAWAACMCCAWLIGRGEWDKVTGLALEQHQATHELLGLDPEETRRWIADLHLHVRDALTGVDVPMVLPGVTL